MYDDDFELPMDRFEGCPFDVPNVFDTVPYERGDQEEQYDDREYVPFKPGSYYYE